MPPAVKLYFDSGVGFLFIRQPCEIVHTGIQSKGNAAALLKGEIPFSAFQFGIIALVNAGQKLHLYLCQLLFESKLLHSCYLHHLFQNSGAAAPLQPLGWKIMRKSEKTVPVRCNILPPVLY